MITKEEYLKAKSIVEEFEQQEIQEETIAAMYCVHCQAFDENECICEEENECDVCYGTNGNHEPDCLYEVFKDDES